MPDSMRVGYLTSSYGRASDTFIRNEVGGLRKLGHDVATFSIRRPDLDPNASDDVQQEQAQTVYLLEAGVLPMLMATLEQLLRPLRFLRVLQLTWRVSPTGIVNRLMHAIYLSEAALLAKHLTKRRIQILHNHIGENSATVAMLAAEIAGIPFSMTLHGPGIFFRPEKWSLGLKIERSAFTAVITSFCRSQCMIFTDPAAWDRLHVVRCTVQPDFLKPAARSNVDSSSRRFVCVGRLCPEKGQVLLVRAVRDLIAENCKLTLTLVGDGPSRHAIESEIHAHGLQDHIQILGWQGSAVVKAEIAASTALVLPSFAEGLPVVIMEALALGRPVITTQIAGIPELVENGKTGWLIAPGSQCEIARALREAVHTSQSTLDAMGAEGTRRVRERHHPDIEISRLEQLFQAHVA